MNPLGLAVSKRLCSVVPLALLVLSSCGGGTLEPFVACGDGPSGTMSADVRSTSWLANSSTRASVFRVSGRVVLITVDGFACSGNANPVNQLRLFVSSAAIDTGSYPLGAADQRANYTAYGIARLSGREFRSDLSDNLGTGTGTVRFTTITSDRVRGTFEFVAVPSAGPGARDRIRVTAGSFDIPVVP